MKSILSQLTKEYIKQMGLLETIDPKAPVAFANVQTGVWHPAVQRHITPAGLHLPGKVLIKDPFAKKDAMKMVVYSPDYDQTIEEGREISRGVPQYVRFGDDGLCLCQEEDIEKYYFLMVHNKRRDNPFRLSGVGNAARFYMVDAQRDAFKFVSSFEYEVLAGTFMEEAEMEKLLNVARSLNDKKVFFVDLNKSDDIIRQELVKVIKQDPMAFLLATKNIRYRYKMLIDHEVSEKNILWDENKRHFYWRKNDKAICEVAEGNKPYPGLLDFACSQNDGAAVFVNELKIRDESHKKILAQ